MNAFRLEYLASLREGTRARSPAEVALLGDISEGLRMAFPSKPADMNTLLAERCLTAREWASEVHQDLCRMPTEELRAVMAEVEISGFEYVEEQLARGKAMIFAGPHYGLYLLGSLVISDKLRRLPHLTLLSPPWRNASVGPSLKALRSINPSFEAAENDGRGTIKVLRFLRNQAAVFILYDQLLSFSSTLHVPLFGHLFNTMAGIGYLARKTGSVIIPYFCHPEGGDRMRLEFHAPLVPCDTDDDEEDVAMLAVDLFEQLEGKLRALPEHWHLWHEVKGRMLQGFPLPNDTHALRRGLELIHARLPNDDQMARAASRWHAFLQDSIL